MVLLFSSVTVDLSSKQDTKKKRRDGKYTVGCNGNAGGLGWTKEGLRRWNIIYAETAEQRKHDAELGKDSREESIRLAVLQHWSEKCGRPTTEATGIRVDANGNQQHDGSLAECAIEIMDDCLSD